MHRTACGLAALALGCAPGTTRPAFRPYPEALTGVVQARPERVTAEIAAWLAAEGVRVAWVSPQDGYLETEWFGARTSPESPVKIRCWADPYVPGQTTLTVEPVYRPVVDPSRTERDLELVIPRGQEGHRLAERLLGAVQEKFGSPTP